MISMIQLSKFILLILIINGLWSCDSDQQRLSEFLRQGTAFYKAGDLKNAQTAFDNALAVDPEHISSLYQIADSLFTLGDLNSASVQYQNILKKDEKQTPARLKLGQIFLLAGKPDTSEQLARQVLLLDAENIEAKLLLGKAYATQNNTDAAFVEVETVLQKKPDDEEANTLLASLLIKSGQYEKAASVLNQTIEKKPKAIKPRLLLAELQANTHLLKEAEQTLVSIIQIAPEEIEHRQRLAILLINQNRLDDAEKLLRLAVNELPENEQAELLLVNFLASQRKPEIAIAELIPMIERQPKHYQLRFKLADLQMALQQADKVEETLKEIIDSDQVNIAINQAKNSLARLYLATNRLGDAKALVKALLELHTDEPDALLLQGEIDLAEQQVSDAVAVFRKVLSSQPGNLKALKLLSNAHVMANDLVLARENSQKMVELAPKDESARLGLANILLQTGDTQQALQQLAVLFKLNPNNKNGLEALFKVYVAQKEWDKAQQVAQQFQRSETDIATGYFLSGLAYQAEGKIDKSIARYLQVLDKQPLAVEPLTQLVKSYLVLKQPDKAISKLNELIKQHPENFVAYSLLGGVYSQANKLPEAAKAYQKAIIIKPDWPSHYRNLALVYQLQNNDAEAIKILQEGLAKAGENNELVSDLAAIFHQNGDHGKVLSLYEGVYQHQPKSLVAVNNLASYLSDYGQDKTTLERAAKLAEVLEQSNDPFGLDTVAWIAYKKGDYEKAERLLLHVIQLNPDEPVSHYHLGMVYFQKGDKNKARQFLEKAVSKKAEFYGWNEAMKTLKSINGN
jgi:tetratricopeptide (TPR) repeat protein